MSYRVSKRTRNRRESLSTTPSTIKVSLTRGQVIGDVLTIQPRQASPDDEPTTFITQNAIEELKGEVEDLRNRNQSQAARFEELENQIAAMGGAVADRRTQEVHSAAISASVTRHTSQAARVEELEKKVTGLLADKMTQVAYSAAITDSVASHTSQAARLTELEKKVRDLLAEKKTQENRSFAVRESVLTRWENPYRDSISDQQILQVAYSGDICADIEAIAKMENFDRERSKTWKEAFLRRYGVSWHDCKANDNLRGVSWEMIQVFNMRAYFLREGRSHEVRTVVLCDAFISIWKDRRDCRVPADQFRRLRDLYYKN